MKAHLQLVYFALVFAYKLSSSSTNFDRFRLIKHNATENHPGAYVFEEMRPAYRECAMDSGKFCCLYATFHANNEQVPE